MRPNVETKRDRNDVNAFDKEWSRRAYPLLGNLGTMHALRVKVLYGQGRPH